MNLWIYRQKLKIMNWKSEIKFEKNKHCLCAAGTDKPLDSYAGYGYAYAHRNFPNYPKLFCHGSV
jgi:hypothetical protein